MKWSVLLNNEQPLKGLFSFFNTKKKKKSKINKMNGHIVSKIIGYLIWPNVMFLILFKWFDSITFPFSIKFMFISVPGNKQLVRRTAKMLTEDRYYLQLNCHQLKRKWSFMSLSVGIAEEGIWGCRCREG